MNAPQIVYRTSTTQTLYFLTRPDFATRRQLRAAGWRYGGNGRWWANVNSAAVLKPKQLEALLAPATPSEAEQPEPETAVA